ncbi:MAG TPA: hypothetical protein VK866_04695 [Acidimicrobiales bacterium]|nr:hypothetical protein [Acidimicrobiales bacterium]
MRTIATAAALALVLVLTGCGDDGDDPVTDAADEATDEATDATTDAAGEGVQDMADDMAEDLEDMQDAVGGGSAVLTIGDETWEFDSVLCAVGPDETGRDDTPFVLSSIQDGLQLDATINTEFGHSVSINDITDFENPSVAWSAGGPIAAISGGEADIIEVDGKDVRAEGEFFDDLGESLETTPGTLTATCP